MIRHPGLMLGTILVGLLTQPGAAMAVDGVIEINQASALAGDITGGDSPGFPVTLDTAGSYRLTGNLSVADPDTHAIEVTDDSVSIDLNGFRILGPGSAGSGVGVLSSDESTTVRNGTIVDMGDDGLRLANRAVVLGVTATSNGGDGIVVGKDSVVESCLSIGNDGWGLRLTDPSAYRGNVLNDNDLGTVENGANLGDNLCDGVICPGVLPDLSSLTFGETSPGGSTNIYFPYSYYVTAGLIGTSCGEAFPDHSNLGVVEPNCTMGFDYNRNVHSGSVLNPYEHSVRQAWEWNWHLLSSTQYQPWVENNFNVYTADGEIDVINESGIGSFAVGDWVTFRDSGSSSVLGHAKIMDYSPGGVDTLLRFADTDTSDPPVAPDTIELDSTTTVSGATGDFNTTNFALIFPYDCDGDLTQGNEVGRVAVIDDPSGQSGSQNDLTIRFYLGSGAAGNCMVDADGSPSALLGSLTPARVGTLDGSFVFSQSSFRPYSFIYQTVDQRANFRWQTSPDQPFPNLRIGTHFTTNQPFVQIMGSDQVSAPYGFIVGDSNGETWTRFNGPLEIRNITGDRKYARFFNTSITANRVFQMPDANGTLALAPTLPSGSLSDEAIARWDGTTGLLQDSGLSINDSGQLSSSDGKVFVKSSSAGTHGVKYWAISDGSNSDTGDEVCAKEGQSCVDVVEYSSVSSPTDSDCATTHSTGVKFDAFCE